MHNPRILVLLSVLGAGRAALADEPDDTGGTFLTLDRMGARTAFGVGTSLISFPDGALPDTALRVDIYGRWRMGAWGLYGQMSWTHVWWQQHKLDGWDLSDMTAASDLEGGVTYSIALPQHELFLRAGVILPTASNLQYAANFAGSYARWGDLASLAPGSLWLRPGATLRGTLGVTPLFYQLDATVCVPFQTDASMPASSTMWVVNGGLGARFDRAEVTSELVNVIADAAVYHSAALSLSYALGEQRSMRAYVGFVLPFVVDSPIPAHVVSAGASGAW